MVVGFDPESPYLKWLQKVQVDIQWIGNSFSGFTALSIGLQMIGDIRVCFLLF